MLGTAKGAFWLPTSLLGLMSHRSRISPGRRKQDVTGKARSGSPGPQGKGQGQQASTPVPSGPQCHAECGHVHNCTPRGRMGESWTGVERLGFCPGSCLTILVSLDKPHTFYGSVSSKEKLKRWARPAVLKHSLAPDHLKHVSKSRLPGPTPADFESGMGHEDLYFEYIPRY